MARVVDTGPPDENRIVYDDAGRDVYYSGYSPFARIIWTILTVINFILGLRFLLRLFSANPAAGFTNAIYNLSAPLINPFLNVIRSTVIPGLGVFEWSTLLAMIVYWLVAYLLVRLFSISRPVARY